MVVENLPRLLSAGHSFDDGRPGRQSIAQLTYGAFEDRMAFLGRDFRQRLKNKATFVHRGVRDGQPRRVHDGMTKQ